MGSSRLKDLPGNGMVDFCLAFIFTKRLFCGPVVAEEIRQC
jgi:hypothetical protein